MLVTELREAVHHHRSQAGLRGVWTGPYGHQQRDRAAARLQSGRHSWAQEEVATTGSTEIEVLSQLAETSC